jgi:hypothetical protein
MAQSFTPSPENSYYIVVPRNSLREGSYEVTSDGSARPQGGGAYLPQEIIPICP